MRTITVEWSNDYVKNIAESAVRVAQPDSALWTLAAFTLDAMKRMAELQAAADDGYMHWIGIPYTELERRVRDVEDGHTIPHEVVMQRIREQWGAR
jgi:hypothetical protein